jgi:CheY-like chemotaxis protein
MSRILIADDQNDVQEALRILLKGEGHQTDAVTSLTGVSWTRHPNSWHVLPIARN